MNFIIWFLGVIVWFSILYFVVKAAVRAVIREELNKNDIDDNNSDEMDSISKITCQNCGKEYEMDFARCPSCNHINQYLS